MKLTRILAASFAVMAVVSGCTGAVGSDPEPSAAMESSAAEAPPSSAEEAMVEPSTEPEPTPSPTAEPTPEPVTSGGFTVSEHFADRWVASGGEAGPWGAAAAEQGCFENGASCWQRFTNGTMRWRDDVGLVDCAVLSCVALTFDDGPSPETSRLLDALVEKNVHATFFVVGNRLGTYEADLQRESALGMQIGNHSWDHPNLTHLSAEAVAGQLADANARITEKIGYAPTMMRPPYGAHNSTVDEAAGAAGMAVINWSAGPADWEPQSVESLIERTLASSTRGAIILLHDIHAATVDAVPGIIDGLEAAGYTVVTVEDLLGPVPAGSFWTAAP